MYRLLKKGVAPLKRLYDVEVINQHYIPRQGKVILALNHPGRSDGFLTALFLATRPIHFLAKSATFRMFWPYMHLARQIPVYRGEKRGHETIAQALKLLRKEKIVGIYPEGRSGTSRGGPYLDPFKTGVARLALLSRAPVIPIAIIGTYAKEKNKFDLPKTRNITFIVGKPLHFTKYPESDHDRELNKRVAGEIHDAVLDLLLKYDAPAEYLPKGYVRK